LAGREVFSPTYTPPEKMIPTLFAPCTAQTLRGFWGQNDKPVRNLRTGLPQKRKKEKRMECFLEREIWEYRLAVGLFVDISTTSASLLCLLSL
ncbi:MAG: hypothetical protein U0M10_01210, partial [Oscillospiraceae bacterium]|nr:hypothetical protein [Oscillospiraceae bacterium]